jgi:adenylate kinase family enzyme
MLIQQYLDYLQEGYVFSNKTVSIDLDKFISGEKKKLIIAGLSGSGKSTLCGYLAKKYKAECFETDRCGSKIVHKDKHFGAQNPPIKMLKEVFYEGWVKCIKPQLKTNKRQVVEGGMVWQGYLFFPEVRKEIRDYPIIILGHSALKSSFGVMQRLTKKHNLSYSIKKIPIVYARNFSLLSKMLDTFRDKRISTGGDIQKFKLPKL